MNAHRLQKLRRYVDEACAYTANQPMVLPAFDVDELVHIAELAVIACNCESPRTDEMRRLMSALDLL